MTKEIKHYCETCKVRLNKRNFKKHFDLNHKIRTTGYFVLPAIDGPTKQGCLKGIVKGIALSNAKAGEEVIVAI